MGSTLHLWCAMLYGLLQLLWLAPSAIEASDPGRGGSQAGGRGKTAVRAEAISDEATAQIDPLFREHVGGAALVIDHGKVLFRRAYGLANVEEKVACTPGTSFRIASMSKQFTAMAIMLLVERGKLSLDTRLDQLFPGFPAYGGKITVRHLLNHTSGLPDYEGLVPPGTTLQLHDLDVLQLLLETTAPQFPAGTKFQYSNSGYALLAVIVEVVSGMPFHRFLTKAIFKPLGMDRTVEFVRGLNTVPERAFGYSRREGGWARTDQSVTSAVLGDGGVYTSLDDYAKWIRALDAGRLISKAAYHEMYTPSRGVPTIGEGGEKFYGQGTGYGFGWFVTPRHGQRCLWHEGGTRGFSLVVHRYPERQAAVVVFLNEHQAAAPRICQRIVDLLLFRDSTAPTGTVDHSPPR